MSHWSETLVSLRNKSTDDERNNWPSIVRRSTDLSVGALVVNAIASVEQVALIDRSFVADPQVVEALERFAPGLDPATIAHYPTEALRGLERALRGALFEVVVAEQASRGAIDLPDGAEELRIVEEFSTPGHDAVLLRGDGSEIGVAQLKTSDSADIIAEHLDRYPDIDLVLASTEAARDAAARGMQNVIDTGVSNAELKEMVSTFLNAHSVNGAGDVLDGVIPEAAYLAIAIQFAWRALRGHNLKTALSEARTEAILATSLSIIATACSVATGSELARIPVVIAFGATRLHLASIDRSTSNVRLLGESARAIETRSTPNLSQDCRRTGSCSHHCTQAKRRTGIE
jgi:hypothetical protein